MEIVSARRKEDLVIVILQDNNNKKILIEDLNRAASTALNYNRENLSGNELFKILDQETKQKIIDHIEYEKYGIDISSILAHTRNINLIARNGQLIRVKVKVFPTTSSDQNIIRFELLARAFSYVDELAAFRESLSHYEYSLDEKLKIMDSAAVAQELSLLSAFSLKYKVDCCIAIIELKKFTAENAEIIIKIFKKNSRSYDEIGLLENSLIIFLIGCEKHDAVSALNRLMYHFKEAFAPAENIKICYFSLKEYPIYQLEPQSLVNIQGFCNKLKI